VTAGRICCDCDQAIRGDGEEIGVDSASAARPSQWRHRDGDPACKPSPVTAAAAYRRRRRP
jgi:hypothetical protein